MKNRLEIPCYLTYQSSREHVNQKGEKVLVYTFADAKGNTYENALKTPLTADPGTLCNCTLICGKIWRDAEKRYDSYFYVASATAAKQK